MDDLTIGQRAARLIDGRPWGTKLPVTTLMEMLGTNRQVYYNWRNGKEDPSAKLLAKMALAGYDVLWVLTGMERRNEK